MKATATVEVIRIVRAATVEVIHILPLDQNGNRVVSPGDTDLACYTIVEADGTIDEAFVASE